MRLVDFKYSITRLALCDYSTCTMRLIELNDATNRIEHHDYSKCRPRLFAFPYNISLHE